MLLILDVLRGINVNDMAILSFAYNCYHKSKKKKEKKGETCLPVSSNIGSKTLSIQDYSQEL